MKILIDNQPLKPSPSMLPMLIHYPEGLGGSLFSVSLAAEFIKSDFDLVFYSAYTQAREELQRQLDFEIEIIHSVDQFKHGNLILDSGNETLLKRFLGHSLCEGEILLIKNYELLRRDTIDDAMRREKIILSGNLDAAPLDIKPFNTVISFADNSNLPAKLPPLKKFESFWKSRKKSGIARLVV